MQMRISKSKKYQQAKKLAQRYKNSLRSRREDLQRFNDPFGDIDFPKARIKKKLKTTALCSTFREPKFDPNKRLYTLNDPKQVKRRFIPPGCYNEEQTMKKMLLRDSEEPAILVMESKNFRMNLIKVSLIDSENQGFQPKVELIKEFKNVELCDHFVDNSNAMNDGFNNVVFFVKNFGKKSLEGKINA